MKYKIINLISSFAIRFGGSWKEVGGKIRWVERVWAEDLESYAWWLKWQYNLKYHGKQKWAGEGDYFGDRINSYYTKTKTKKFLFRLLV